MPAALASFAQYVRPEVPDCPDILIHDAIRRAGIDFCKRSQEFRSTITIATVAGQSTYPLSLGADLEPQEIVTVRGADNRDFENSSEAEQDELIMDVAGAPNYFYLTADGDLVLYATPEGVETITVKLRVIPSQSAATLPDALYTHYREAIACGAKAKLMAMTKKSWFDLQGAAINKGMFDDAIAESNLRHAKGRAKKPLRTKGQFF